MSAISDEKVHVAQHAEDVDHTQQDRGDVSGFDADTSTLPKGYFYSRFIIGSYAAIGFGLWAGTAAL